MWDAQQCERKTWENGWFKRRSGFKRSINIEIKFIPSRGQSKVWYITLWRNYWRRGRGSLQSVACIKSKSIESAFKAVFTQGRREVEALKWRFKEKEWENEREDSWDLKITCE